MAWWALDTLMHLAACVPIWEKMLHTHLNSFTVCAAPQKQYAAIQFYLFHMKNDIKLAKICPTGFSFSKLFNKSPKLTQTCLGPVHLLIHFK